MLKASCKHSDFHIVKFYSAAVIWVLVRPRLMTWRFGYQAKILPVKFHLVQTCGISARAALSPCCHSGDATARRMTARCRADQKCAESVHAWHGSGRGVGRTLRAVMEARQRAGGRIEIAEVLRPYMGGATYVD